MSYGLGRNVRIEHPLKTEIYKKGYTITNFAKKSQISRRALNDIFSSKHKVRGDTIYLISQTLEMPYDKVSELCQ